MKLRPSLLVLLFVACACALLAACVERVPKRFPHELHLTRIACGGPQQPDCLSCASCHQLPQSGVPTIPDVGTCSAKRCHEASESSQLAEIQPIQDERAALAKSIRFNHQKHLEKKQIKGQCVPCHGGAIKMSADNARFPPMSKCFECHEHRAMWDRGQCFPCHARPDIEHLLPRTFLRHDAAFAKKHGQQSRENGKICAQCHTESQCNDCHDTSQRFNTAVERRRPDAIERTFVHRGDFVSRHSIEAKSQPARCARCHEPRSCDACHVERGVSGNRIGGVNPHPTGWVGPDTESRDFHGHSARRDILTCAGCHDQGPATNCIRCHKVGGYGGNPHPHTTWPGSKGAPMCRYCHE
jgi:hypothetical protein